MINMDHTEVLDKEFEPGVFGAKSCFEIMDLYKRLAYGYPVKDKEAKTTQACIKDFLGDDTANRIYSDGHESIVKSAENLCIPIEASKPGVPRNNCIIEGRMGDQLRGIGSQFYPSGFLFLRLGCLKARRLQRRETTSLF